MGTIKVIVVILLLLFIIFMIHVSYVEDKLEYACQSHGWESGYYNIDDRYCTQTIKCLISEVIDGKCKPIDLGK